MWVKLPDRMSRKVGHREGWLSSLNLKMNIGDCTSTHPIEVEGGKKMEASTNEGRRGNSWYSTRLRMKTRNLAMQRVSKK